ncbi:MAG: hypothetical protein WAZ27_04190 [Minisyncoccia bacterium]
MLSLFPELLFLAPFAAFMIRVTVGVMLGMSAYRHVFIPMPIMRTLGILEGVVALLLIAGGYTQAAAMVGFFIFFFAILAPGYRRFPHSTLVVLLILCLSLMVTGAGPFAFDLPL